MKLGRIVTSLLENDLYKFSMGQAIYHQFSDYKTTWSFKCRNKDVHFTKEMVEEIREQIKAYCELRFTEDELSYLDGIKWIKGSYIDFLRLWKPRYEDFTITDDAECGLVIETAGTWLNTSMYEIPTLAIVNEVFLVVLNHLLTPYQRITRIMTNTRKQCCECKLEIFQETVGCNCICQCCTVQNSIFLNPCVKCIPIRICRIVLVISLSYTHNPFMCHCANWCNSVFFRKKYV